MSLNFQLRGKSVHVAYTSATMKDFVWCVCHFSA